MPYPKQPGTGGGDADLSKAVLKTDNLATLTDMAAARLNLQALYKPDNDGIEGWEALRARAPQYDGERVRLKYHTKRKDAYANYYTGGGMFIGRKTARADDGGYVASAGGNYHWVRDIPNIGVLTVDDFGGCPDGVINGDNSTRTDNKAAITAMFKFVNSPFAVQLTGDNSRRQNIKFNAGIYYASQMDFSNEDNGNVSAEFGLLSTVHVVSGLHCATTLISDKTNDGYMFKIRHRRMSIHGINWHGQQTVKQDPYDKNSLPNGTNMLIGATMGVFNDTASNRQGFLQNLAGGGQQGTIDCFKYTNTGGVCYDLLDTLDFETNQIFGSYCAAPVFRIAWSGTATGVWDHATAWKLRKANFQYNCAPAIVCPRITQTIWEDVWFEHGVTAFDASQAHITMIGVSVESSKGNPHTWRSRLSMLQYSAPGPTYNWPDFDTTPTLQDGAANPEWRSYPKNPDGTEISRWQDDGEIGFTQLDPAFTRFNNPVSANWFSGSIHGANTGGSNSWIKIGRMRMPLAGTQFRFIIEATNGYNAIRTSGVSLTANNVPGRSEIVVQRTTSGFQGAIEFQNQSAVLDNRLLPVTGSSTDAELYVQISGYIGGYSIHIFGTGDTRYESGAPCIFYKSGEVQTSVPAGAALVERSFWGRAAGFGIDSNTIHIKSINSTTSAVYGEPGGYIKAYVNGSLLNLPWHGDKATITTQPASQTVATGGTLTLTSSAPAGNSYQWYKDNVAISGATSAAYTKASVTSADAGSYKVRITGAPVDNFTDSNTVTVTVT